LTIGRLVEDAVEQHKISVIREKEEATMLNRILGVFRLSAPVFEDIEHDKAATGQAALVVILVAVLVGLGSGFTANFSTGGFLGGFASSLVWALVGWFIWSLISYLVGTALFGGVADLGEMLRVIGFAMAPLGLAIIPCLGGIVGSLWALAAGFVAVRQGLDFDNTRALLTILAGFLVYVAGYMVVAFLLWGVNLLF
jgi:hypothetical protein